MDLKYLYHRQQISMFMAENAASEASRRVHLELAARYSRRIAAAEKGRQPAEAA